MHNNLSLKGYKKLTIALVAALLPHVLAAQLVSVSVINEEPYVYRLSAGVGIGMTMANGIQRDGREYYDTSRMLITADARFIGEIAPWLVGDAGLSLDCYDMDEIHDISTALPRLRLYPNLYAPLLRSEKSEKTRVVTSSYSTGSYQVTNYIEPTLKHYRSFGPVVGTSAVIPFTSGSEPSLAGMLLVGMRYASHHDADLLVSGSPAKKHDYFDAQLGLSHSLKADSFIKEQLRLEASLSYNMGNAWMSCFGTLYPFGDKAPYSFGLGAGFPFGWKKH